MIRHLLKMVWNRKRINGLITIEIFFAFVVLFGVVAVAAHYFSNYRMPLGFSIERVWSIRVNPHLPEFSHRKEIAEGISQLTLALRDFPEIESIGGMTMPPYSGSTGISGVTYNGRNISANVNQATDGLKEVLNVDLTAGRWFSPEDDGATFEPAIINERLAKDLYGSENPLGKELPFNKRRVVGVVRDFRKGGEFSLPVNYLIERIRTVDTSDAYGWDILIRLRPGTTAAFTEPLIRKMESVEKDWSFEVASLERDREADFKFRLAPVIAGGVIAGFLLFMVALGLIGVLWQNVSQRTKEIGLRRAMGGTAKNVSMQIHGEQFIITTLGLAAGSILVMQVPLLDLIGFVQPGIYFTSLILSLIVMYAITYLCSLFPSWLAMEVQPADALHYE